MLMAWSLKALVCHTNVVFKFGLYYLCFWRRWNTRRWIWPPARNNQENRKKCQHIYDNHFQYHGHQARKDSDSQEIEKKEGEPRIAPACCLEPIAHRLAVQELRRRDWGSGENQEARVHRTKYQSERATQRKNFRVHMGYFLLPQVRRENCITPRASERT